MCVCVCVIAAMYAYIGQPLIFSPKNHLFIMCQFFMEIGLQINVRNHDKTLFFMLYKTHYGKYMLKNLPAAYKLKSC